MGTPQERVARLFDAVLELQSTAERAAYLDAACGQDLQLRAEVEELLAHDIDAGSFLDASGPPDPQPTTDESIGERPGTVIGPYKLMEQIGEGGMGLVFVAEQQQPIKRRVALKIIKPGMDSRQVIARFEAERQALALMDHPNIAKVHDGGTTRDGRPYFVMELVKGVPITEHCDLHCLSTRQRLQLFLDVCHAVQHAHQKGIIHRDLKPSNLLVEIHDVHPVVKVIDFGIAKAVGQQLTEKTVYTGVAQMLGTPLYMSPEQAGLSSLDVDTRSDVYSLGVLLYELLTGTTPFDSETLRKADYDEIRRIIREDEPPRPSARLSTLQQARLSTIAERRGLEPRRLSQQLRGELDWIVMKALEKDRNRRYESASAFAADVQRYLADEPVVACPPSAGYRLRKLFRRHKGGLAAAALVLFFLVLVGSGVGWVVRDRSAQAAEAIRQQGERQAKAAGAVESIFGDVDRLEKEQKWPEALEAARRAEAAVAGGDADPATTERVHQRLRELAFLDRLERIRMEKYMLIEGKINFAEVDRTYARAFREFGVDVDELAVETAIDRLKTRPALTIAVAAALDDWVNERRLASRADVTRWKRLVAVARGIDPEPLRDRLRAAGGQPIAQVRDDLRRLAESIDVRDQHPATLFILVRTLTVVALPDAAMRILRAAQRLHPDDFSLNTQLGNYLWQRNDHEGALRFFTAALALRPRSALAHDLLGKALLDQKKLDEAIAACRKAIELKPKYAPGHGTLGVALHRKGLFDEAIAEHHKALELLAQNADARASATTHNNLGNSLTAKGRRDEAILAYKKAIEFDPNYAPAHNSLGVSLGDKGRVEEAVAEHKKAIELDPKMAAGYCNLGVALQRQSLDDEAIAVYRKALELDPKFAAAHYNLGGLLKNKGRVDEAIAEYRKAIELDPKFVLARSGLGNVVARKGWDLANHPNPKLRNLKRAAELGKESVAFTPQSSEAWQHLGWILYRAGNWKASIEALEKSCRLQAGGTGDCGQWIVMSLAHAKLAAQEGLTEKQREHHKTEARRRYEQANKQIDSWGRVRPSDAMAEAIWDFRTEARELLGSKESKK